MDRCARPLGRAARQRGVERGPARGPQRSRLSAACPLGTLGPDGNVWFSEYAGNKIGRITPSGIISEFTIPTASSGPERLSAGPDGNVWFVENTKSKLANVTPDGSFWEIATPTASANPAGVAAAGSGAIWISEDGSRGRIGQNPWVGTSYPPYDNFSALGGPSGQGLPWEQDPLPGHRVPDPRFSLPNREYFGRGWGPAGGGSAGGAPGAGGAQPVGSGPFVGTDPRWPPNGGVNPQPPGQPGVLSSWGLDVVSPNSGDYMAYRRGGVDARADWGNGSFSCKGRLESMTRCFPPFRSAFLPPRCSRIPNRLRDVGCLGYRASAAAAAGPELTRLRAARWGADWPSLAPRASL